MTVKEKKFIFLFYLISAFICGLTFGIKLLSGCS